MLNYGFFLYEPIPGGGMPTSRNRTKWPVQGGAIAVQPGWCPGHESAFFYFNLGLGEQPPNMSHPMLPPFGIYGPTNGPYPGTFCLPQVPLPPNISVKVGDYATIQVIETAQHGASLYNVWILSLFIQRLVVSPNRWLLTVCRYRIRRASRLPRGYRGELLQLVQH